MSGASGNRKAGGLSDGFARTVGAAARKTPPPFSLRLSAEERTKLDAQAGTLPLGAYIRSQLLGPDAKPRRKMRRPHIDQQKLALALSELGGSRLASNMNQIAKAVNTGVLDVPKAVANDLAQACRDIQTMREALIEALGVKPEDGG